MTAGSGEPPWKTQSMAQVAHHRPQTATERGGGGGRKAKEKYNPKQKARIVPNRRYTSPRIATTGRQSFFFSRQDRNMRK
jgi:hypothetical protein